MMTNHRRVVSAVMQIIASGDTESHDWFFKMSEEHQKAYLEEHPTSVLKGYVGKEDKYKSDKAAGKIKPAKRNSNRDADDAPETGEGKRKAQRQQQRENDSDNDSESSGGARARLREELRDIRDDQAAVEAHIEKLEKLKDTYSEKLSALVEARKRKNSQSKHKSVKVLRWIMHKMDNRVRLVKTKLGEVQDSLKSLYVQHRKLVKEAKQVRVELKRTPA